METSKFPELHYRSMFSANKAIMLLIEPSGGAIIDASVGACDFYGYSYSELTTMTIRTINILSDAEIRAEMRLAQIEVKNHFNFQHRLASGDIRDVEVYSNSILVDDQKFLFSVIHDVTERNISQANLNDYQTTLIRLQEISSSQERSSTEKIELLLELGIKTLKLPLAIVSHIDGNAYTVDHVVGPEWRPRLGSHFDLDHTFCVHALNAAGPVGFHHAGKSEISGHPCYRAFGLESYIGTKIIVAGTLFGTLNFSNSEPRLLPFRDHEFTLIRLFADWLGSELARQQTDEKIHQLAMTDQLTGLANRRDFNQRIRQSIKLADREDSFLALVYLDLDRFKSVNDTHGHAVGDALLRSVASILTKSSRDNDIVARLGGDEFAILVVHPKDEAGVQQIAQRIIDEISQLRDIEGHEIEIGVSIGIALYPRDADSEDELMKKSDLALYEVKNRGRGSFLFYQPEMIT
jgi:diguanylate cyclase (GGDEF)-like protein/PAS domain S-box-containing protein